LEHSKICVFLFSLLLAPSLFASPLKGEISSKNNERLRQALKEFPEADTNKDGVLTLIEARAFRAQQRGEEESQIREEVIKPPKAQNPPSNAILKEGEIKGYHGLYMGHSFFPAECMEISENDPKRYQGPYPIFSF
jgi:hypothetical protein